MRIKSLEQLKRESEYGAPFFILLNYNLKSSKWIVWDDIEKLFHIHNFIDETEQELTDKQLMDKTWTNIGDAMIKGALFKDD
ncbi:hypothetical protein ACFL0Q_03150 [Thermodesulfobacteriota bacterium]